MKMLLLSFFLFASGIGVFAQPAPVADTNLTLFGRGMYPGNDTTYAKLRESGFTTIILSSFYIKANGDVFSGDDNINPIIHDGRYVGDKEWLKRVASLKQRPTSVTRIEILLEGRWINQPPNTFDFIQDFSDAKKVIPGITTGTGTNSTLYKLTKVMKDEMGIDAVCIDDESVYNSVSMIKYGEMIGRLNMHMSLCPFRNYKYWRDVIRGSKKGLIDAIYLQCYDGGMRNVPGRWKDSLGTKLPIYPIFLCRGAFSTCGTSHGSKTANEIKGEMVRFKKDYPAMTGGAIWQMADVNSYVIKGCAVQTPESGTATTVSEFLDQLKTSLKEGL
ncbi:hypothetical protein GO495_14565 [Chitinophaga oryziterrae]|uniref:Uncharacterized protein n=1 Tax=Chitinophaga oryziterrae TaxID=1031224 RepID=A0A6N8J9A6_9BACT|nr:hypothetical protein [Chitinophaga oryziterrae]MVT41810.1 hypothetical protein [Chitinophaga oryziterrae]